MNRRRVLLTAAATVPFLAGCTTGGDGSGGDGGTATSMPTAPATDAEGGSPTPTDQETPTDTEAATATTTGRPDPDLTIVMEDTTFNPRRADVETGATVEWVNRDGVDHDVTAARFHGDAMAWELSRTLSSGERTRVTFDERGVYEYYCTIHGEGRMCGAVVVGGATMPGSLPCADDGDEDGGGGNGGGGYY